MTTNAESGPCPICEQNVLLAPDDIMCQPCRDAVSATSDQVTDPVERVLSVHARFEALCSEDHTICRCTAKFEGGPAYHRRHVAEMVYDALGIEGPSPWTFGSRSPSKARFDDNGRIKASDT